MTQTRGPEVNANTHPSNDKFSGGRNTITPAIGNNKLEILETSPPMHQNAYKNRRGKTGQSVDRKHKNISSAILSSSINVQKSTPTSYSKIRIVKRGDAFSRTSKCSPGRFEGNCKREARSRAQNLKQEGVSTTNGSERNNHEVERPPISRSAIQKLYIAYGRKSVSEAKNVARKLRAY